MSCCGAMPGEYPTTAAWPGGRGHRGSRPCRRDTARPARPARATRALRGARQRKFGRRPPRTSTRPGQMDTRTVGARAYWPDRRRRACHALFSPLAAALARGEPVGATLSPRLPRAADPPVGHEPAVVPADATGLWSSWDHRAEPRPAGWGL